MVEIAFAHDVLSLADLLTDLCLLGGNSGSRADCRLLGNGFFVLINVLLAPQCKGNRGYHAH